MSSNLLSADDFRAGAKDGRRPEGMVLRFTPSDPETIGEIDARVKRFVFSDQSVDLAGDVIHQDGWDLKNFKRNPVALFCHCSWDPPIGRAANVAVQGGKLAGDIEFASAEIYPFADTIYRLVDGGFMKAVSVGFVPTEWSFTSDKNRPYGIDFKKQLLSEISVCPLPCNPNALEEARSAGIDTRGLVEWAEKVLDNGDSVIVPRAEIEALRLQAKTAAPPRFYVQASSQITAEAAGRVRDAVKGWAADSTEVLILPPGVTLRAIAGETSEGVPLEVDTTDKSGRTISAATKAVLDEAMTHHEAMGACIKGLMGGDDGSDNEPDDDPDDDASGAETDQPPGSSTPEEEDKSLTPEARRVKEARALRASLGDDK